MAVDARAIGAGSIREGANLSPAISNLQLAFKNGVISGQEIADALIVKPSQQKLQRAQNIASLDLLPLQQQANQLQLEQQVAEAPARAELGALQLEGATGQAEAALLIQDDAARAQRLQVEDQVAQAEGLLGAQPFATPQNAVNFFQQTRPNEKIPQDPDVLTQKNQEAFSAIQAFRQDAARFRGKQTTESFVRVNPETFDQERVRVTFDGAGNVIDEETLGLVKSGAQSLTEQQANAVQFSARMKQANINLDSLEDAGFDVAAISNHLMQSASRRKLGFLSSSQAQQYEAAKRNWIAAVLRKESGAAIAQSEYAGADHQYFPQPRDTAATIAQKRTLRDTALNTMQAAGLFGLPPAQKAQITDQFNNPGQPTVGQIKPRHEVRPDSEIEEDLNQDVAPDITLPTGPTAVPAVNSAAEAQQLPPNVQFFRAPDGRVFRNPNFAPTPATAPAASSTGGVRG